MPPDEFDALACVDRVRGGDEAAARGLLQHLHPLVAKIVRGHLPKRTSEEDLMQMVFAKVFSRLDQFSGKVPLEHWVSRVAVNTCLNQLQRERVRPELRFADLTEEEEAVVQSLASTANDLPVDQSLAARDLVEKLLERLNPEDRLVITLLHLEGKSLVAIREATGWNLTLIKVRAFRARQKLRKHLATLLEECAP